MNEKINKKFRIVVDSSADILSLNSVPFAVAPLKIITDTKEYIDDTELDVYEMVNDLKIYKGKSLACPVGLLVGGIPLVGVSRIGVDGAVDRI